MSPNHRRGIAEALTDATEAMLTTDDMPYSRDRLRHALRTWAFSDRLRGQAEPPADVAPVVAWLERNTVTLADLAQDGGQGSVIVRRMLDRISRKQDGTLAAPNTANRKRMVLGNALEAGAGLRVGATARAA